MKLKIASNNMILEDSPEIELPDFVIITGANGSGKTQLLNDIHGGTYDMCNTQLKDENNERFKYVDLVTINQLDNSILQAQTVATDIMTYKRHLGFTSLIAIEKQINPNIDLTTPETFNNALRTLVFAGNNVGFANNFQPIQLHELQLINAVANNSGKELTDLKYYDFVIYQTIPNNGFFATNLSILFKQYIYKHKHYPELTQSEKAPWILFDEILASANLPYKLIYPDLNDNNDIIEPLLIKTENGKTIRFENLSSGEKTIMSLIFALYNSNENNAYRINTFPEVVLMDEPDASLHPSLTPFFLKVLEDVFVKANDIKVILTTHSPSTVALGPELSIYTMNNGVLNQSSKDKAIKLLTTGLKSLFIYYEHRKQVFVESDIDVTFFEKIYSKLSLKILDNDIVLNFISSGATDGGYSRVNSLVKSLCDAGNKNICGIIDKDDDHEGNERVKVLGKGERRNIENYIFDPIFFALFILKENHPTFNGTYDLKDTDDYLTYNDLDENQIQKLVDIMIAQLIPNLPIYMEINWEEKQNIELICQYKIDIPKWHLSLKKNEIEEIYQKTFPHQFSKYRNKQSLKSELLKNYLSVYYNFLPMSILVLFKEIQSIPIS